MVKLKGQRVVEFFKKLTGIKNPLNGTIVCYFKTIKCNQPDGFYKNLPFFV